jgi:hypothetical protein
LLDRVASIEQLALLTVDVANVGNAASSAHEARVVSEEVGLGK